MSDATAADASDLDDASEGEDTGKKGGKKKIIIIAAAGLLVAALAAGAYFFLFAGSSTTVTPDGETVTVPDEAFFLDLPDMTVNLSAAGERTQFLKLSVSLEVSEKKTLQIIEPLMPRVLDAFQVYLRELRASDLEGSAGFFLLKEELRRRIDIAIAPAQVNDILFREVLIQ